MANVEKSWLLKTPKTGKDNTAFLVKHRTDTLRTVKGKDKSVTRTWFTLELHYWCSEMHKSCVIITVPNSVANQLMKFGVASEGNVAKRGCV